MRISAWLLSQDCAMNTASSPNRTAKPIMTMVLMRTTTDPLNARACSRRHRSHIGVREVLNW